MNFINPRIVHVLKQPSAFTLQVLRAFRANQGLLLAGAVAYYTLLSIVPLLILMVIALSHVIDQAELLVTLRRALGWVVPGQSAALVEELASFLGHREVVGWLLLATLLFFSSLAFRVLESAFSVIFLHRIAVRKRHFLASALMPIGYIVFIGAGLFVATVVFATLMAIGEESIFVLGHAWSLGGVSRTLIYAAGIASEVILLSSIYYFMPVGRMPLGHALIGGATAGLLWEVVRRVLVWYFGTLSQVNVVYGSLTTAIVVLLTLEIAAALLLLGAQVIAEYERIGTADAGAPPARLHIDAAER